MMYFSSNFQMSPPPVFAVWEDVWPDVHSLYCCLWYSLQVYQHFFLCFNTPSPTPNSLEKIFNKHEQTKKIITINGFSSTVFKLCLIRNKTPAWDDLICNKYNFHGFRIFISLIFFFFALRCSDNVLCRKQQRLWNPVGRNLHDRHPNPCCSDVHLYIYEPETDPSIPENQGQWDHQNHCGERRKNSLLMTSL